MYAAARDHETAPAIRVREAGRQAQLRQADSQVDLCDRTPIHHVPRTLSCNTPRMNRRQYATIPEGKFHSFGRYLEPKRASANEAYDNDAQEPSSQLQKRKTQADT